MGRPYDAPNPAEIRGWASSHRLATYDYSQAGAYFITVSTSYHKMWLGHVAGDRALLSDAGRIARQGWARIPERYPGTELDAFVIMPNHVHGIIMLLDLPHDDPSRVHVGHIIRAFKGSTTHAIRRSGLTDFAWQPDYYEHVIRNDADLNRIREYILTNPLAWSLDRANPDHDKHT